MVDRYKCPVLSKLRNGGFARISFLTSVRNNGTYGQCIESCPVRAECGGKGTLLYDSDVSRDLIFRPEAEEALTEIIKSRYPKLSDPK